MLLIPNEVNDRDGLVLYHITIYFTNLCTPFLQQDHHVGLYLLICLIFLP